ncbi:MAG: hypothetical protein ACLQG3_09975 [Terracidiphilus sp.]
MTCAAESGEGFTYYIPIPYPYLIRVIVLAFAAFFLCVFLSIPIRIGPERTFESVKADPLLWLLLIGVFTPAVALFLLLAFPPRSWLARLEFDRSCIRLVPKSLLRWIGEPSVEVPMSSQTQEILVCKGSKDFYSGVFVTTPGPYPYGLRILARSAGGHDRELKVETGGRLSAHQAGFLIEGITASTGLPVRFIKREADDKGVIQELPWSPEEHFTHFGGLLKLAFAATPLIGGAVVGYLRAPGFSVALAGTALWLVQMFALFAYARFTKQRSWSAALYWLSALFTFAASYSMAFVLVYFLFTAH